MLIHFLAILISFATSLYIFRGLWAGIFIGEIFDTRLMIVLHEHWFRFFSGKTSFLDAGFFYPYPRSFALTDTFLLTGITHSLARLAGIDVIDSWAFSQFIWVFIGLFGWFLLANKILKSNLLKILIIPLIGTSFPFIAHLNERPNVVPYLLISWVFFALFAFYTNEAKRIYSLYFGFFLIFIPLIVLTSWYAGFFIVVYLLFLILVSLALRANYLKLIFNKIRNLDIFTVLPFSLIALSLTSLWAYIYLPELENSAEVARPKSEVIDGSPTFVDIFNNSALGGSKIFNLLSYSYQTMEENKIGINVFSVLILLPLIVFLLSKVLIKISSTSRNLIYTSLISGLILEIIILKFNNYSIFIFLFDNISFLKSIRTPVRWHIYLMFLIIIILIYLFDNLIREKKLPTKILLLIIPLLLLVEQQRTPPGMWMESEFLDQNLINYQNSLNKCKAFVVDRPDTGYWSDMIQALALSIYTNKPTVNGYSGSVPKNYPSFDWYSDGNLPAMGDWLKSNDALDGICLLDGFNYTNIAKFDVDKVDFIPGSGFTGLEKSQNSTWAWSVWEQSTFFIQNFKSSKVVGNLIFNIEVPECIANANFQINGDKISESVTLRGEKSINVQIPISLTAWERLKFTITKDPGFCNIPGDPRELHFSLKDVRVQEFKY